MANTLDKWFSQPAKPQIKEEAKAQALPSTQELSLTPKTEEATPQPVKRIKKERKYPPIAPSNLPPSYLISASYDGKQRKAVIKL
jgi:hypothetical protein